MADQIVNFEGVEHHFPGDFSDQDISDALAQMHPATPETRFSSAQKETQTRQAANTPTFGQQVGSTVQQIGQNIWEAVKGGAETLRLATGGVASPEEYQKAKAALVQPQLQQFQKAGQAATGTGEFKGAGPVSRVAGTLGYGAAGLLPGVGPMAARGGEKAAAKDYPGAIADVGAAAALSAAPEYIGDAASAVAGKVRQFTTPNPDTTFYQALGQHFRQEMPDYYEMSPVVRGDIQRAATATGGELNDIPSTLKGTQAAKAENRAVVDMHVDPYRQAGWTGRGDPIADEIVNSIPATLRARAQAGIPEAVAEVNRIVQEANVYRRPFTPDEIFGLNREFNAGLNNVFNKTADQQHALVGKGGDTTTLVAAARGARNLIRNSFGDDVANLQRRWGWLDDVETALRQKWKAVTKSPEETPASDLDAAMLKAGIPGKLTHGDVSGAKFAWRGGKTDSLLQDTFNNTEPGWPLPTPQPGGMPGVGGMPRARGPQQQLPPATPRVGQPQGGSYVSATGMPPGPQQNVWQGIGAPRQLPTGQVPFTQGTSAVNPAATPPRGPTRMPYNAGLLPAPTPGQPPVNVLPRGPASVQTPPYMPQSAGRPIPLPAAGQEPIVQQMGKTIWEATKPTETPGPAAAPETAAPAATPKPNPVKAPTKVDTRLEKALGTLTKSMGKVRQSPPGTAPAGSQWTVPPADLEDASAMQARVQREALGLTNGQYGTRVRLSDLRQRLPGSLPEQDAAIRQMSRDGKLTLMPNDDPRDVTPADEAAAIQIGDRPRHLIYLTPPPRGAQ